MQIIHIENNDRYAKIQDDGVDGKWSVYLMDNDPEYTKEYSRAYRDIESREEALDLADAMVTNV